MRSSLPAWVDIFIQEKTNTALRTELTSLQKNDELVAQLQEKNRQLY